MTSGNIRFGPDGNIWIGGHGFIGEMMPQGGFLQDYTIPSASSQLSSARLGFTFGPDGNIWYTEPYGDSLVGRLNPTNGQITEFPFTPAPYGAGEIIVGPDGNLWFEMTAIDAVGRVHLDGSIDLFNLPPSPVNTAPRGLTAGPDGNLWMTFATEQPGGIDSIYRVNTAGQLTGQFNLPTPDSFPYEMTAGPDGALWFTELNTNQIGRITTAGVLTDELPIPTPAPFPNADTITSAGGNIWFGEYVNHKIGEVVLQTATTTAVAASTNPSSFGQTVTFTATVNAVTPNFPTPTGSVDFVDTTTNTDLGTVALSGGSASLTTSSLPPGNHVITATYNGGGAFLGSSGSLTQTVTPSVIVLDPTASGALTLSGNASLTIPGSIAVDSTLSTALVASGNAQVQASNIQVVGGIKQSGNASLSPAATTGVASVPDPLASLSGPSTVGLTNYGSASYSTGSHTLQPGIYSQISASGTASLTLSSGLYLIEGGGFSITGSASVSGSGVMIYNTGSNYPNPGGSYGGITLSGNGTFNLSASATSANGTDAGIVIFQSRANTRALGLSGNAASAVTGAIYAPNAQLVLGGNASLNGALVVDKLQISGNGVSTQVVEGATGDNSAMPDTLLAGNFSVYVNDPTGYFTANELARIQDAITAWDTLLAPYNVQITEVSDPTLANVVIDDGTTSAAGSAADGVLGCYNSTGEITILQGWNWYDGSDPTQIGSNQYDFQTVVTHELGHALGLGGSADPTSPMDETLATAVVRRRPTVADLNIPEAPDGADPERAALPLGGPALPAMVPAGDGGRVIVVQAGAVAPLSGSEPSMLSATMPAARALPGLLAGSNASFGPLPGGTAGQGLSGLVSLAVPEASGPAQGNRPIVVSLLRSDSASSDSGSAALAWSDEGQAEDPGEEPAFISSPGGSGTAFQATVTMPTTASQPAPVAWRQACEAYFVEAERLPVSPADDRLPCWAAPEVGDSAAALAALALFLTGSGRPQARSATAPRGQDVRCRAQPSPREADPTGRQCQDR